MAIVLAAIVSILVIVLLTLNVFSDFLRLIILLSLYYGIRLCWLSLPTVAHFKRNDFVIYKQIGRLHWSLYRKPTTLIREAALAIHTDRAKNGRIWQQFPMVKIYCHHQPWWQFDAGDPWFGRGLSREECRWLAGEINAWRSNINSITVDVDHTDSRN